MTKTKKSKNKKVVLASALLLAGVIAVGGTFAWFTSKDEVTNRLTASSSYGVSITENFTPPGQWTAGQNITKEVAAVNTGNVAAYVKLDLTDAMSVTKEANVSATSITTSGTIAKTVTAANDYVVLTEDEVKSIEAGGQLVYMNGLQKVVTVVTDAQTSATTTTITYKIKDGDAVDTTVTAGEFYKTITTSGLYVFERSDINGTVTYDGYYVDASDTSNPIFYKVDVSGFTLTEAYSSTSTTTTNTSNDTTTTTYSITRSDFNFVKEVTTTLASASAITFSSSIYKVGDTSDSHVGAGYTETGVYYIQAVYDPDGTVAGDEIIINIALDGTWSSSGPSPEVWTSDNWTAVYDSTNDDWTFYYNHVLSAGTTSDLLVTDMQLDTSVTSEAYTEFTYDLNVALESVQVVAIDTDSNGISKIELPSSSITWEQSVGSNTYSVNVKESTSNSGGSAANNKLIYVNEYGQVCTSKGVVKDDNNVLTWSFSTSQQ